MNLHRTPKSKRRKIDLRRPWAFFFLGVIEDMLAAFYTTFVASGFALGGALAATLITLLAVFVLSEIVLDASWKSRKLWAFAAGNAAGTFIVVSYF